MEKDTRKILSALSYPIWIVGLIALLLDEKDKDLKYHGAQGLTFGILFWLLWWVLNMVLWRLGMLFTLLWVVWLVLAIMYAVKAYNGERFKIPVVYDIMRKFKKTD